jgi:hypothetical protein
MDFTVRELSKPAIYPEPQFRLNQILKGRTEPIATLQATLHDAYIQGKVTWPFGYGSLLSGLESEEPSLTPIAHVDLLQEIKLGTQAKKIVRLYQHQRNGLHPILFRSVSYYPDGGAAVNELPKAGSTFPIHIKAVEESEAFEGSVKGTLDQLIRRVQSQQLNLDVSALLKPLMSDYIAQDGQKLQLTENGKIILKCLNNAGLTARVLYIVLRALEGIYTNESSYHDIMSKISKALGYNPETHKFE